MIDLTALPTILIACFLGGIVLGYGYFKALRATAELIVGGGSLLLGLGLTLGRICLLAIGLYLAVQGGAFALLAALAGVLCAKAISLRQAKGGEAWTRR